MSDAPQLTEVRTGFTATTMTPHYKSLRLCVSAADVFLFWRT
jgi:hypothetical protein